jgi:hypothetical protein
MSNSDHFYASNADFVKSFDKGDKPLPPARRALVLTCMDARLHPEKALGLEVCCSAGRAALAHAVAHAAAQPPPPPPPPPPRRSAGRAGLTPA